MKLKMQDMEIQNKTVLLRCDFSVPIKDGKVFNDNKLRASLDTIKYLQEQQCKIIILSHLGRVKTEGDKKTNSLKVVSDYLKEYLSLKVTFFDGLDRQKILKDIKKMKAGEIILHENTRFYDIPSKAESGNDIDLAIYYASLADIYINDAFGTCHRAHASTVGVAKLLPSGIGFLVQKELEALNKLITKPLRPFTVIMGGAKIDDKLALIESLIKKCDYLLLAGGLANTFLAALDFNIGASKINKDMIASVKTILAKYKDKIILPLDVIGGNDQDDKYTNYSLVEDIKDNDIIYDIGPKTVQKFEEIINQSKTIFLNGTMGLYEDEKFREGTSQILKILSTSKAQTIVGGGDGVGAVINLGFKEQFDFLSTGGGATLEYITNKSLPALEVLPEVKE